MKSNQNRRVGLTLTELLVVVSIVIIVTAVLAPLLMSSMEGREVREAARQINAYFQSARTRAKQLGRPVGVVIQRSANDPNKAYQLSMAEEVPPYTGFDEFSRVMIDDDTQVFAGGPAGVAVLVTGGSPSGFPAPAIQPNDEIRFNYRGPRYRILKVDPAASSVAFRVNDSTKRLPRFSPTHPIPYEVFRRPRMSASTPLDLPTGAAILMNLSGVGLGSPNTGTGSAQLDESALGANRPGYIGLTEFAAISETQLADAPFNAPFNASKMPLAIMFNPSGEVSRVYRFLPPTSIAWPQYFMFPPKRPQAKIFLFLGNDTLNGSLSDLADTTNLWVTIDPLSGTVTTAPNSTPTDLTDEGALVSSSRQLAATGQSIGGR